MAAAENKNYCSKQINKSVLHIDLLLERYCFSHVVEVLSLESISHVKSKY